MLKFSYSGTITIKIIDFTAQIKMNWFSFTFLFKFYFQKVKENIDRKQKNKQNLFEGENKNVHFSDFQEFIPSHLIENVKNLHIRVKY